MQKSQLKAEISPLYCVDCRFLHNFNILWKKCAYWRFPGIFPKVEKSPLKVEISPKIVVLAKFQKFWCKKVGSGIFGYLREFSDFFPKWRNPHLKWRNLHFEKKSPMNKRFWLVFSLKNAYFLQKKRWKRLFEKSKWRFLHFKWRFLHFGKFFRKFPKFSENPRSNFFAPEFLKLCHNDSLHSKVEKSPLQVEKSPL